MKLFLFLSIGFSITNAVVFLHVFHWLRRAVSGLSDHDFYEMVQKKRGRSVGFRTSYLGRLVRCHACVGFWIGVFLSLISGSFINEYMSLSFPIDVVADGLLMSGFNFVVWVILKRHGATEL